MSEANEFNQSPYEKVKSALDQRAVQSLDQARSWQMVSLGSLALLSFSVAGNIYLGMPRRTAPFVVAVQQNGETSSLKADAEIKAPVLQRATSFFLSRFVILAREIPSDPVLLRDNMGKLFQLVDTQGKALLTEKLKEQSPSEEFKNKNRALKISSVLEISKGIYQVDWFEAEYDKQGQKTAEYPMRGTFKIAMLEPKSDAQIRENPLGIFVDYFSWTRLGG